MKEDILPDLIPFYQTDKFCHMIHNLTQAPTALTNYSSRKIILCSAGVCKVLDSSAEKSNISGVVFNVFSSKNNLHMMIF